jgi:Tfp pilus assembly protein PilV
MEDNRRQSGFSLIETMLAVATLAIGMVFVAGTFTAGVYFASTATESTISTVVADEAVAKIGLYGLNISSTKLKADGFVPYDDVSRIPTNANEAFFPDSNSSSHEYAWSAICRQASTDGRLVNFTIFVSRLMGSSARYWGRDAAYGPTSSSASPSVPCPVRIEVNATTGTSGTTSTLTAAKASEKTFLDTGFILVGDDAVGQIYRVLDRSGPNSDQITIAPAWQGATKGAWVWVVPRPVSGGRCPAVAVYQKVMRF